MDITIFDWEDCVKPNNHEMLPNTVFRCLLIGESNSGKTNLLLNLLLNDGWLDYNNLILVGASLSQGKYKVIIDGFSNGLNKEAVRTLFSKQQKIKQLSNKLQLNESEIIRITGSGLKLNNTITIKYYDSNDTIPSPAELDKNLKTIIVFDDCVENRNQEAQRSYFTRGRHQGCTVFYLSQSYFQLDRRLIRNNTNFLILFKLSEIDVQHLWTDRVAVDMPHKEFMSFCKEGWEKNYSFIVIDFTSTVESGQKYRHGFDGFYIPSTSLK
jgi:hypothetical protein